MAEMTDIKFKADDFFTDARVNECDNHACLHNTGIGDSKCNFQKITLNYTGACQMMDESK